MKVTFPLKPQGASIWLGGNDLEREGNWIWQSSGNDIEYTRFQTGEPNGGMYENCLTVSQENGVWGDWVCTNTLNLHICEKPAPSPKPTVKEGK